MPSLQILARRSRKLTPRLRVVRERSEPRLECVAVSGSEGLSIHVVSHQFQEWAMIRDDHGCAESHRLQHYVGTALGFL